jgi:uncharacterized repeat protein (TIGR03803 family)
MATRFHWVFLISLFLALASLSRGQTLEVLHSFSGFPTEGAGPKAGLIQTVDGNFYGTTESGGTNGRGTVFKMTQTGTVTNLAFFSTGNGRKPTCRLVQGNNGDLYGTTFGISIGSPGPSDGGTVFKVTTNGVLTTLVSFTGTNGFNPFVGLVQGTDGGFYGATDYGGPTNLSSSFGFGTIFKVTPSGVFTMLMAFNKINGAHPVSELVQGSDGNFYGTTEFSTGTQGTIFQITPAGSLTTLHSFGGPDGTYPYGKLLLTSDGSFYGTTYHGGAHNLGTVFRRNGAGVMTTLVSFNGSNGRNPIAGLVKASDGNFYGTTEGRGTNSHGTVFKMKPDGELTTLTFFAGSNGSNPWGSLLQADDGNLYGTTYSGGASNCGTIFRIVMPAVLNSRVSGNELVLSWPTNHVGFTLQSSTNLNSSTNWIDSTSAPAVVGAQFTVTNSISNSAQFYRLKKP